MAMPCQCLKSKWHTMRTYTLKFFVAASVDLTLQPSGHRPSLDSRLRNGPTAATAFSLCSGHCCVQEDLCVAWYREKGFNIDENEWYYETRAIIKYVCIQITRPREGESNVLAGKENCKIWAISFHTNGNGDRHPEKKGQNEVRRAWAVWHKSNIFIFQGGDAGKDSRAKNNIFVARELTRATNTATFFFGGQLIVIATVAHEYNTVFCVS